jgi:aldose 1-epimerase
LEYGAIITRIIMSDENGIAEDVVLGYDDLQGYINDPYYFGATIGRVANRIGGAKIGLGGQEYQLAPNTLPDFGHNGLHGGTVGFNKVLWKGTEFTNDNGVGVVFEYLSADGEEGYPGEVNCKVKYTLNSDQELQIDFQATTDQLTVVNMTHHSYFNLAGAGNGSILEHSVKIKADSYTAADEDLIPTGEIFKVDGLAIDFKEGRPVGSKMDEMQMDKFKGYDLNYILKHTTPGSLDFAAYAKDIASGRKLEVYTTQPCMHFYTSNFLEGKSGKGGKSYEKNGALCFEPQGYPDALNHANFETVELNPGEQYQQTIVYKFSLLN